MTETLQTSHLGCLNEFADRMSDMEALCHNLILEQHVLGREATWLTSYAAVMSQEKDEAGIRELSSLLASYLTWASHRRLLGNC